MWTISRNEHEQVFIETDLLQFIENLRNILDILYIERYKLKDSSDEIGQWTTSMDMEASSYKCIQIPSLPKSLSPEVFLLGVLI